MASALVLIVALGLIYWFLAGRPHVRGTLRNERLYLRRGPRFAGVFVSGLGLISLAAHTARVETLLLIIALTTALGLAGLVVFLKILRRDRTGPAHD
jgi:hypothetical protein